MLEPVRDTIPRLHRVVDHARDQLLGIAAGHGTFEQCRVRYGETQESLVRQGRGRVAASRVSDQERNWSTTCDVLGELMRWGALEQDRLPSSRAFLSSYLDREYRLTDKGRALAAAADAKERRTEFLDLVSDALIDAHPYFRGLLAALQTGPIICPVVEGGDIERGRQEGKGTDDWGLWGAELIGQGTDPTKVAETIRSHLTRRFGERPPERPSNKALAEATNDAFAVSGFAARGLGVDGTSIKTLLRWGSELLLFDKSRYVPEHANSNVIWLAADLEEPGDEPRRPRRRMLRGHGERLARAILEAYRRQSAHSSSSLAAPYLPIHSVRAEAAFSCGVTRPLVDMVLSRLVDNAWPELGVTVLTHIGTGALPDSERPAFRHHGRRRLEMTITNTGDHS
jgi:hypothetical protein